MLLSVILPTRNRAAMLSDFLRSIKSQTSPCEAFEIIVVDNGSTDETLEIVREAKHALPNMRYVYEREPGLHAGRHCGMKEARGDVLTFADDDIEASPTWLESIIEGFSDPSVDMVGGNNLPMFLELPPEWLRRLWNKVKFGRRAIPALSILQLPGGCRPLDPLWVWGCNYSIRKTALVGAGGFHPDSFPIDLTKFRGDGETHVSRYVKQSGRRCLFHPGASVYHKVTPERMSVSYFRKRAFNQGISDSFIDLRRKYLAPVKQGSFVDVSQMRQKTRNFHGRLRTMLTRDRALKALFTEFATGYEEGYLYHQQEFASDSQVRDWVLRANYF